MWPCRKLCSVIRYSWVVIWTGLTICLMIFSIVEFRHECFHSPIPPSKQHLKKCGRNSFVDQRKLVLHVAKGNGKKTQRFLEDTDGQNSTVVSLHNQVLEYFAKRRSSTKQSCLNMFDEEDNKSALNSSEKFIRSGNSGKKESNRFFMKTFPGLRTRWIFYKHHQLHNELELQWCPLYKSASSPWMAIFTTLVGALTPITEKKIRQGKATFVNLAKDFRLFVPESGKPLGDTKTPKYGMVVVRHPFDRILSAYRDKIERIAGREFYQKKYAKTIFQRFRRAKKLLRSNEFKSNEPLWFQLAKKLQQKYGVIAKRSLHSRTTQFLKLLEKQSTTEYLLESTHNSKAYSEMKDPDDNSVPTFEEFCQYLLSVDPRRMDEHWRPQYLDCSPCHHQFDLILHVESIEEDKLQVLKLLGYGNSSTEISETWYKWSNKSPHKGKHNESFYFSQLSRSLLAKLYEIYEPDFVLFGYSPEKYFSMTK